MGLNDKDTKMQMISTLEAYKVVSNLLASTFGDVSGVKDKHKFNKLCS